MKPLSRLEPLTEPQRAQVAAWLEDNSYEKVIELAHQQFGVVIPRMTLSRFRDRVAMTDLLDDSPESAQAAAEIVQYAATGQKISRQPRFMSWNAKPSNSPSPA